MNWIGFFIAFMVIFQSSVFAQKTGVFLKPSDFNNKNLTFVKQNQLRYKFILNNFFNASKIKIIIGDSTFNINKDSIFGFRNEENVCYRFYLKETYEILNPEEKILLYRFVPPVNSKETQFTATYFFSVNSNSAINPLTKFNLKRAFPNDTNFHELIDMYFQTDIDLLNYDFFYGQSKINRIYQISSTKK